MALMSNSDLKSVPDLYLVYSFVFCSRIKFLIFKFIGIQAKLILSMTHIRNLHRTIIKMGLGTSM